MNSRTSLLLLLLAFVSAAALAAPQDPDPSLGSNGVLALPFFISGPPAETDYTLERVAQLADGRIAMVGRKRVGPVGARSVRPVIAVVGENGEPVNQGFIFDSEWNPAFAPVAAQGWLNALLTLPDGSLLYCGGHSGTGGLFNGDRAVVGRIRPDLNPDLGFGEAGAQGWMRIALGLGDIDCHSLEQLAGGRILVGGSYVDQNLGQGSYNKGSFLAMLTAQGQLDPSFGNQGVLTRLHGSSSVPGVRYLVASLRQGRGDTLDPARRPVVVIERDLGSSEARVFSVRTDGAVPISEHSVDDALPVIGRGLGALRLPTGALQTFSSRADLITAAVRFREGQYGFDFGLEWETFRNSSPLVHRLAGLSLDSNGQSLAVLHSTQYQTPNGGSHGIRLMLSGNDGTVLFDTPVGSGLDVPAGQQELLDPADALIQSNRRYLVLFNRSLMADGTAGPQRAYLRRFLGRTGGNPGGASWSLDLVPDSLMFPAADAAPLQTAVSASRTVSGLSVNVQVPAWVEGGELSINEGAWTSGPVELGNGHRVRLRGVAPGVDGGTRTVRLRAGGQRATNSWYPLAETLSLSEFVIAASQSLLPGTRCSDGALNGPCSGSIPDAAGALSSSINLIGSCPFIQSVRIGVDISHPRVGDLRLSLRDPNGDDFGNAGWVRLLERAAEPGGVAGSCAAADVRARFDDQAELAASEACGTSAGAAGIAGPLQPHQALGTLLGRAGTGGGGSAGNGLWTLVVRDMASGASGTLNDWSIELDCAASLPAASDLRVSATGDSQAIAGTPFTMSFQVQNQGPARSAFARFLAEAPTLAGRALVNSNWTCSASAGSACILPAGGCTLACAGPVIDPGLDLLPGGSATITVSGTVDPSAAGGSTLVIDGRAVISPNIAGNVDPDPSNNQWLLARDIVLRADLAAQSLTADVPAPGQLHVQASYANLGPSLAPEFGTELVLPQGYSIQSWSCSRGGASCGPGSLVDGGRTLRIDAQGSPGDGRVSDLQLIANFAQPQPSGLIVLRVQHAGASPAQDPSVSNNERSVQAPIGSTPGAAIFANGFE